MTHGSLFSGIGGFDLAAEQAGIKNIFQVEINDFCRCVLKKNFPNTKQYNDIKIFNQEEAKKYRGKIDIVSGGFPCQPFSVSGKRKGTEDDRYLWDEMFETIGIIKPEWCIIENVPGLLTISGGLVFKKCISDLENEGYQTETYIIPALSKNLLHRRDRIWIIANSDNKRGRENQRQNEILSKSNRNLGSKEKTGKGKPSIKFIDNDRIIADSSSKGLERKNRRKQEHPYNPGYDGKHWVEVATEVCGVDNGLSAELDGFKFSKAKHRNERIKALGNAIVPGIAFEIFQAIIYSGNNNEL